MEGFIDIFSLRLLNLPLSISVSSLSEVLLLPLITCYKLQVAGGHPRLDRALCFIHPSRGFALMDSAPSGLAGALLSDYSNSTASPLRIIEFY